MVTNLTGTCPYATMCGWCSKWDKECDRKIGVATPTKINTKQFDENNSTVTKVQDISVSQTDSALTAVSSYPKKCGSCLKTDGMWYASNPPQVKCIITGKFHFLNDDCDCDKITATAAAESYTNTTTPLTSKLD